MIIKGVLVVARRGLADEQRPVSSGATSECLAAPPQNSQGEIPYGVSKPVAYAIIKEHEKPYR